MQSQNSVDSLQSQCINEVLFTEKNLLDCVPFDKVKLFDNDTLTLLKVWELIILTLLKIKKHRQQIIDILHLCMQNIFVSGIHRNKWNNIQSLLLDSLSILGFIFILNFTSFLSFMILA